MKNSVRHIVQSVLFLLMLISPIMAHAQFDVNNPEHMQQAIDNGWAFDFTSVEALIKDHKEIRSVLTARSGVEQVNKVLHDYAQAASVDYDSLNVKLDKYTKCFDIIDLIYNSGMAVLNVYTTSSDVTKRIGELEQLIEQFSTQCAAKGNIVSSDTIIIGACRRCVEQVVDDGKSLTTSLIELAQYALGLRHMTTAELMTVISSINDALDSIRESVDHAYFVIWKYVTIRTHYFKQTLYNHKTVHEISAEAFSRWRSVTREVMLSKQNKNK